MIWRRCGALIVLAAAVGCATPPAPLTTPRVQSGVELAPYAVHMECIALASDERIAYRFVARIPVVFSVQFREGNALLLPVEIRDAIEEDGSFAAQERGDYCLVWEAGPQGSVIDYRVQPVRPRR